MAWIRVVSDEEAEGLLTRLYEASQQRAGRVFNIVRVQSQNPRTLKAGVGLYREAVLGKSPLSRGLREMVAVVVSKTNGCQY